MEVTLLTAPAATPPPLVKETDVSGIRCVHRCKCFEVLIEAHLDLKYSYTHSL
jgi:hypothetical protein